MNKVSLSHSKFKRTKDELTKTGIVLRDLGQKNVNYSVDYFSSQWETQRHCQLQAMADGSSQRLEQCLATLLDLKEDLNDAQ